MQNKSLQKEGRTTPVLFAAFLEPKRLISSKVHQISNSAKTSGGNAASCSVSLLSPKPKAERDYWLNSGHHLTISIIWGLYFLPHGSNETSTHKNSFGTTISQGGQTEHGTALGMAVHRGH